MWNFIKQAAVDSGALEHLENAAARYASSAEAEASSGGSGSSFASVAAAAVGQLRGVVDRGSLREAMPEATPAEIELPLQVAKLSKLTYRETTTDGIRREVAALVPGSALLWYQPQELGDRHACWFLARGRPVGCERDDALILVFRGTNSDRDVEADLLVSPVEGPHGGLFHGGFLSAVRDDTTLHAQLARHAAGSAPLYLLGHSLGGALAMVMLHANLIPPAHTGAITCVALGSPKVSLGRPPPNSRPSRLLLLVNAQDTVPRLLGSPMVVLQAALQVLATKGSARGNQVAMPTNGMLHTRTHAHQHSHRVPTAPPGRQPGRAAELPCTPTSRSPSSLSPPFTTRRSDLAPLGLRAPRGHRAPLPREWHSAAPHCSPV